MNYKVFKETILKYTAEYGKNGPYQSPTKKSKELTERRQSVLPPHSDIYEHVSGCPRIKRLRN
jgi:hypothetical protein